MTGHSFSFFASIQIIFTYVLQSDSLSCHECGHMYDGATFMGIQSFDECQFFEHDIAEDSNKFLKVCPEDEQCCFSLREHMSIEFWGHAAAAEVFVHGCCSSLNKTPHHLLSSSPPPLVTTNIYRAEIMSQTIQNGDIKTRVMYCNTLGCNSQRVPWSEPVVAEDRQPRVHQDQHDDDHVEMPIRSETDSVDLATRAESNRFEVPIDLNGKSINDDLRILALLERGASRNPGDGGGRETERQAQGRDLRLENFQPDLKSQNPEESEKEQRTKEDLLRELASHIGVSQTIVPLTRTTESSLTNEIELVQGVNQTRQPSNLRSAQSRRRHQDQTVCECQCSCPAPICPTFRVPSNAGKANGHHILSSLLNASVMLFWIRYHVHQII